MRSIRLRSVYMLSPLVTSVSSHCAGAGPCAGTDMAITAVHTSPAIPQFMDAVPCLPDVMTRTVHGMTGNEAHRCARLALQQDPCGYRSGDYLAEPLSQAPT